MRALPRYEESFPTEAHANSETRPYAAEFGPAALANDAPLPGCAVRWGRPFCADGISWMENSARFVLHSTIRAIDALSLSPQLANERECGAAEGRHEDHQPGRPFPEHQQTKRHDGQADVGGPLDGVGPHGRVEGGQQDAHDGGVDALQSGADVCAGAQGIPERQRPHEEQERRRKDGDRREHSANPPVTEMLAVGEPRNGIMPSRFKKRIKTNIVHKNGT